MAGLIKQSIFQLYGRWNHLPWVAFDSTVGERQAPFVWNESAFAVVAILTFAHACCQPAGPHRQLHKLLYMCSLFGGLANDVLFSYLPIVDNFWHAQATVMLTPRFPLYLFGVYTAFLYVPTALAWRLRLSSWSESGLVALLACTGVSRCKFRSVFTLKVCNLLVVVYAPWDVVGAKMLWWTWHDTDKTIGSRFLGVVRDNFSCG